MPVVKVSMFADRTKEQKVKIAKAITQTVAEVLGISASHVNVIFESIPRDDWMIGGTPCSELKF